MDGNCRRLRIGSGPAACVASPPAGWPDEAGPGWFVMTGGWCGFLAQNCHIDFMKKKSQGVFLGLGSMILDVYQVWNLMGNSESALGRKRAYHHFHQVLMRCLPSSHPWSCLSKDKQSQPVVLCIQ